MSYFVCSDPKCGSVYLVNENCESDIWVIEDDKWTYCTLTLEEVRDLIKKKQFVIIDKF